MSSPVGLISSVTQSHFFTISSDFLKLCMKPTRGAVSPSLFTALKWQQNSANLLIPWKQTAKKAQWYNTELQAGWLGVWVPAGAGNFSLHHCVQTGSEAHPASYLMGTRGSFPGVKWAQHEADHSPPLVPRSKNAWSYTSTPPICLHGMVLSEKAQGQLYALKTQLCGSGYYLYNHNIHVFETRNKFNIYISYLQNINVK
jgi:hypothetical protein